MEINLKSSVGKSFAALFEPTLVARIMDSHVRVAESQLRSRVLADLTALSKEELGVNSEEYVVTLDQENGAVVEKYSERYREVHDSFAHSVVEAWEVFRSEYELLSTGSGSEHACVEAFMSLCELLQDS